MMDPGAPSSSTSPTDLRRSKRNKFHLDIVAAVHGTSKKIKMESLSVDTSMDSKSISDCTGSGKPTPTSSTSTRTPTPLVDEELGKRKRRSTAHFRDYGFIFQDEDENDKGFIGDYQCKICPSRYETKAGLNNHIKLHSEEKRRFQCELCNFSANTTKAHQQHDRIHKHFGVVSAQASPAIAPATAIKSSVDVKIEPRSVSPQPPILEMQRAVDEDCNMEDEEEEEERATPPVLLAVGRRSAAKKESMRVHVEKERIREGLPKDMKCPNCPFVGKSWTRLRRHLNGHELNAGYQCAAKNCTYKCATSGFLKRHYTLHKEQLPWPPVYVNSSSSSSSSSQSSSKKSPKDRLRPLAQIKSFCVTKDGALRCNVERCGFTTTSRREIISHKIKLHNAGGGDFAKTPFVCTKCGFRARNRCQLRVHKLSRHFNRNNRRNMCNFFLKEMLGELYFIKLCNPQSHIVDVQVKKEDLDESFDSTNGVETSDVTFHCDLCPYKACSASRVERHRAKHFVDHDFKCLKCSYSCRSQELMNQHERLHLDPSQLEDEPTSSSSSDPPEVKIVPSPSTQLGLAVNKWSSLLKMDKKTDKINENFTRVMVVGQKMFQCVECPYASKYRGDIRGHKLRHTASQEFRCTQCSYSAQRPVSLRDHFKLHITANSNVKSSSKSASKLIGADGKVVGERRGIGKSRIYCCEKCPYTTSVLNCLWRHYRQHKKLPKVHVCSDCDYSSIDKKRMDEHMVIHVANGNIDAFVRRVNKDGRPMPMLSDYSYQMSVVRAADMMNEMIDGEKKSSQSMQPTSSSTTRPHSERSTRTKNNYYQMVNNPGRVSTPTPSSSNVVDEEKEETEVIEKKPNDKEVKEEEEKDGDESVSDTDEQTEVSHFALRELMRNARRKTDEIQQCQDCPYTERHPLLFNLHRTMHTDDVVRPYACCECNYSVTSPSSLKSHLKLHWPLGDLDTSARKRAPPKRAEHIPSGAAFFKCRNCQFRTVNAATMDEHKGEHIKALYQRVATIMKRNAPRDDYQKPKMKYMTANRNLKCCVKCLFRCSSNNHFVAHVDRHGWKQLYRCRMCDYSDPTKSVVDFHETNHHVAKEHSLTDVQASLHFRTNEGFVETPTMEQLSTPTIEEVMKTTGSSIKCALCDYITSLPTELSFHMVQSHGDNPNAVEASVFLNMGFLPPISNVAACNS